MSADRAVAYAAAITTSPLLERMRTQREVDRPSADLVEALLREIARAWVSAENGIPSEAEAQRWSRVCSAAERVISQ